MCRFLFIIFAAFISFKTVASEMPNPPELRDAVEFWKKVYTQVTTRQGYIHDADNLAVIYQSISFPAGSSSSQQDRIIRHARDKYEQALRSLGAGKRNELNKIEAEVLAAWPTDTSNSTFRKAVGNVRFQRGQSDRFRDGLVRSGQWKPYIRSVLSQYGLPPELEALPHVESSFNPEAYSKVAAAGMWQFMPATARLYMEVDNIVDQRMCPYSSTEGAARLLKNNFEVLGTWPLALTAYNFGTGGMAKATKTMGTTDIGTIVKKYRGKYFGFASRNFYASFLAALEIDRNPERFFGHITIAKPQEYDTALTREFISAKALARTVGVDIDLLRQHNPALLEPVWTGEKHIPKNFLLRLPMGQPVTSLQAGLAAVPESFRYDRQQPDLLHRIAPGESLSVIASRYDTSIRTLMALNGIRNPNKVRAGQNLILPGAAANASMASLQSPAQPSMDKVNSNIPGDYVVRRGDSIWSISRKFGVSQKELIGYNQLTNAASIIPGQRLSIPTLATISRTYVIKSGDSLSEIARRFNVSEQDIIAWNNLPNRDLIRPGQVLKLISL